MIFKVKMFDLCIRNGRVIDWKNRLDTVADLGICNGKIEALGTSLSAAKRDFDASGQWVVPGIIDSHMHASSWLGGQMSFRMLALAGVTTALDMAGPVESVKEFLR
ncbi:MAG TPA: amidohydrolase, partial [Sutterella sp.]|nr:amidohydrolase [Sutterella sp.]